MFVSSGAMLGAPAPAQTVSIIGGTPVVLEDGAVLAEFVGDPSSLFNNQLFLDSPGSLTVPIFQTASTTPGALDPLGPFSAGTPLLFRDQAVLVSDPGSYNVGFFTGTGADNPDGLPHAVFTFDPSDPLSTVAVGFEDTFGGGDADYNDLLFTLENVGIALVPFNLAGPTNPAGNLSSLGGIYDTYAVPSAGTFDNLGSLHLYGELVNSGTFNNSGDLFSDLTSTISNELGALLTNESTGTLNIFGLLDNDGAVANSGFLTNAGLIVNVGTMIGDLTSGFSNVPSGFFENFGTFQVDAGGSSSNAGSFTNFGIMGSGGAFSNSGALANSGFLENSGLIVNTGTMIGDLTSGFSNTATGVFTNTGMLTNSGLLENSGTIQVDAGGSVSGPGSFIQYAGTTIVNGQFGGSGIEILGGVLSGAGTLTGPTTIGGGGTIEPGNSPGSLGFDDDLLLLGGVINIELFSPSVFDILDIAGAARFDGGTINYLFQYTPSAGDTFAWLTADLGLFGESSLAYTFPDFAGLSFETFRQDNSLILTARSALPPTGVPEPGTLLLMFAGVVAIMVAARRRSADGSHLPQLLESGRT